MAIAVAIAVALGACAQPVGEEQRDGPAAENPLGAHAPDPARDALLAELGELRDLLAEARGHLEDATEADSTGEVRDATGAAIELLAGDPGEGTAALFPVEQGERGASGDREDRLTSALTVTREAGGTAGQQARELLRDLVAGDLGAWQRDAEGMLAMVTSTTRVTGSLEEIEAAVFELPGEATRGLAWAMLAQEAGDPERAGEYAHRGATHLDVAVTAIDELDLEDS